MKVFISYTRNKDAFNVVTKFRDHLANELSQSKPGSAVFQDKSNMRPGDRFPVVIADSLNDADVLLVLVSPAWLASDWCRREFEQFCAGKAASGRSPCIVPVLWVSTPTLEENSTDPIAAELAKIHYTDFRDLHFQNWDNPELLRSVAQLAELSVATIAEPDRIQGEGSQSHAT